MGARRLVLVAKALREMKALLDAEFEQNNAKPQAPRTAPPPPPPHLRFGPPALKSLKTLPVTTTTCIPFRPL